MSTASFNELTREIGLTLKPFRSAAAGTMQGFDAMAKAAMVPGSIDAIHKELIALAIGVAMRCDGCIGYHAKALVRLGATPEQIRETLEVAVYMGGGPSLMHAADALRAYEEFSKLKAASS